MTLREAELAARLRRPQAASPPPGDAGAAPETARLEALSLRAQRAWRNTLALRGRAQAIRAMRIEVSAQELLAVSRLARLHAQAATMPVIEQAKGVLMAQQGCGEDEAFDLLRRASQRSNTPVRVLAERIVNNLPQRSGPTHSANGSRVQRPR
jgi:ANTAR domain-containing protein